MKIGNNENKDHNDWFYGRFGKNEWHQRQTRDISREYVHKKYELGNNYLKVAGSMNLDSETMAELIEKRKAASYRDIERINNGYLNYNKPKIPNVIMDYKKYNQEKESYYKQREKARSSKQSYQDIPITKKQYQTPSMDYLNSIKGHRRNNSLPNHRDLVTRS